jgi:hypothetical protein
MGMEWRFPKIRHQEMFLGEREKIRFAEMDLENLIGRASGSTESQPEGNLRPH